MSSDLDVALELADIADVITMASFRDVDLRVETKPDMTPVSAADRSAEEAVRAHLANVRPRDAILGEEFGGTAASEFRWVIDPIDGTKGYVRGLPVWATLIAGERDGTVVVGVVSAPALGRRWWAERGAGAFANGEAIRVSAISRIEDAQVSCGWDHYAGDAGFAELARRAWRARGFGDFWSLTLVAEGAVDVAVEPGAYWDLAAPQVIVEEAGGRFTDLAGTPGADCGHAVATNGVLHDEVLALLGTAVSQ